MCTECRKAKTCLRRFSIEDRGCELFSDPHDRECFICGSRRNIEEHHIFGGSNRKRSTQQGLTVDLCSHCHRIGKNAVHTDAERARLLHYIGQLVFEKTYGDGMFLQEFRKNYL